MTIRIVLVQLSPELEGQVRRDLGAATDLTITAVFDSAIEAMLHTHEFEVAIGRMTAEVPAFATTIVEKNPTVKVVLLRQGAEDRLLYERHPRLVPIARAGGGALAQAIREAINVEIEVG